MSPSSSSLGDRQRVDQFAFYDWDLTSHEMVWSGALSILFKEPAESLTLPRTLWIARCSASDRPTMDREIARLVAGQVVHADLEYTVQTPSGERRVRDRLFAIRKDGQAQRLDRHGHGPDAVRGPPHSLA